MAAPVDVATASTPVPGGGVPLPPSPERLQQLFDNGIWYALSLWPALHVACQNSWGGEDTADKRDWFAGAVSELFSQRRDTDQEDLECFLLQVMQDEFDCNVEDESEVPVARTILGLRKSLMARDLGPAVEIESRWRNRGRMKMDIKVIENNQEVDEVDEVDGDDAWEGFGDDDDEDDDADGASDVEMSPGEQTSVAAAERKQKEQPEVDADGFTKVVGKKRR